MDVVECPYCRFDNDMSDGLTDLPKDNCFDHECTNCGEEFEVYVEFEPSYSGVPIVYVTCDKCGKESRDFVQEGRIAPFPERLKGMIVCRPCYHEAMLLEYRKRNEARNKL